MRHLETIKWDYADLMQYADLGGGGEVWYVYNSSGERGMDLQSETKHFHPQRNLQKQYYMNSTD